MTFFGTRSTEKTLDFVEESGEFWVLFLNYCANLECSVFILGQDTLVIFYYLITKSIENQNFEI